MFYFILFIGIALMLFNQRQWKTLQRSVKNESAVRQSLRMQEYLMAPAREWRRYALGDGSWQERKGAIIMLLALALLLFLNENWLGFSLFVFLPVFAVAAFITQIKIGRNLHRRTFENQFPEVLAVITAAVSAGNSIHQAVHRCGEGINGALGLEFNRIDRRLNLGEEPERVLRDAWLSYRYREFFFFNVVILISLQHGGQLKVLIGRLTRIIVLSKNMARRKMAMTAEARTSAKIVAAIPLLFLCGMKYLKPDDFDFLMNDSFGRLVLYYVIASEALGISIIWWLLRRAT